MYRLLLIVWLAIQSLCLTAAARAANQLHWNGPKAYTVSGRRDRHSFSVRIEQANFMMKGRKITVRKDGSVLVDGRAVVGRDWSPSRDRAEKEKELRGEVTEIVSIRASIDGQAIRIPKRLYADLLNPDLGKEYVTAKLSKDGRTLVVDMEGSDGAGAYHVTWKVLRNGKVTRDLTVGD